MEDKFLVKMCKGGSKKAFERIYVKYRDYLLITAIALSNNIKDAEDAVHRVPYGLEIGVGRIVELDEMRPESNRNRLRCPRSCERARRNIRGSTTHCSILHFE